MQIGWAEEEGVGVGEAGEEEEGVEEEVRGVRVVRQCTG